MRARRVFWALSVVIGVMSGGTSAGIDYEVVSVVDGVHVFRPSEPGVGNSVAVVTEVDVLFVDTGATPSGGRRLVELLRGITDRPVRYLVNTHWHDDHVWGNQAFLAAYPGAEFLAHAHTREDVTIRAVPGITRNLERLDQKIAERTQLLERGTGADGEPLDDTERQQMSARLELLRAVRDDFLQIEPVLPTMAVSGSATLYRKTGEIQLLYHGRGHTRGDLAIYLPSSQTLITGDLLTYPIPTAVDANVLDWLSVLRELRRLDVAHLVPGHGPVMHGREYLEAVLQLIESVAEQARELMGRGVALEEWEKRVDVASSRATLAGEDPRLGRAFDALFLKPILAALHRELSESGPSVDD